MSRQVIYRRDVNPGSRAEVSLLVVEHQLSDRSRVHDVHIWVAGQAGSLEIYNADSERDAIERCDKLHEVLA